MLTRRGMASVKMFQMGKLKGECPGPEHEERGGDGQQWKEQTNRPFVQNIGTSFLYYKDNCFGGHLTKVYQWHSSDLILQPSLIPPLANVWSSLGFPVLQFLWWVLRNLRDLPLVHFLVTSLIQNYGKLFQSADCFFLDILVQFSQKSKSHAIHWHRLVNPLRILASTIFFFLKKIVVKHLVLYPVHWWYLRIISIYLFLFWDSVSLFPTYFS